jgi:WXG100 family type VII secretion target
MSQLADQMVVANSSIQSELRRLEGVVASVTSGWRGEAAMSYQQLQRRWNEDATVLNRVLSEIKEAMDTTTRRYVVTEERQRSNLSGIRTALG